MGLANTGTTLRSFRIPTALFVAARRQANANGDTLTSVVVAALAQYVASPQASRRGREGLIAAVAASTDHKAGISTS